MRAAAMEFSFYRGQEWDAPSGLGRFSKGGWEFPVKPDGVPESHEHVRGGRDDAKKWTQKLPLTHLASAGGKLFVANSFGVYSGPGRWKEILKPSRTQPRYEGPICGIRASADGKGLVIWESVQNRELRRHVYDVRTAKVSTLGTERAGYEYLHAARDAGYLLSWWPRDTSWRPHWMGIPTRKEGLWAVGPLGTTSGYHTVVETAWAVWIASRGELIRLDRKLLAEWLGSGRD